MKKVFIVAVLGFMTQAALWAAPFKPGNLVIYRVGDGVTLLTNAGNYVFLDEITTNGTLVQSISLPQSQFIDANGHTNYPIVNSAAATSEGLMTLSVDGRYLVFAGYATNSSWGKNSLPNDSNTVPRVIGRADWLGQVDTTTALTNFAVGGTSAAQNPRGVASTDGVNFWITSPTNGVMYVTLGNPTVTHIQRNNNRAIAIFDARADLAYPGNQQLYFDSSTRVTAIGTNLPTTGSQNTNLVGLAGPPLVSPWAFVALPLQPGNTNIDTLYLTDEGNTIAGSGGVSKWCYDPNTATWNNFGSFTALAFGTPAGVRGIAASVSVNGAVTNVTLYLTAGSGGAGAGVNNPLGLLYVVTDSTGYNGTIPAQGLPAPIVNATNNYYGAGKTNIEWRGIAWAPSDTFRVTSAARGSTDLGLTWNAVGGNTYVVQANPGTGDGSYNPNAFVDISPSIFVPTLGPSQTNFVENGGATNKPSRYYRVRQTGLPLALAFGQQPTSTGVGQTISAITVRVVDQSGFLISNSTAPISIAIDNNPSGGNLSGTLTVAAVGGIATFSDLSIDTAGNGYTLVATSGGFVATTSSAFNITP
jgi:hypothetical protein